MIENWINRYFIAYKCEIAIITLEHQEQNQ